MNTPLPKNSTKLRLLEQKNALAPRAAAMVAATKQRVKNTRSMIAQSKTLLGKAHQALESSRAVRATLRRASEAKL